MHLAVSRTNDGRWRAQFLSRHVDEKWEFDSIYQAERWLRFCFVELYPRHRCDGRCIPGPALDAKHCGRKLPVGVGLRMSL